MKYFILKINGYKFICYGNIITRGEKKECQPYFKIIKCDSMSDSGLGYARMQYCHLSYNVNKDDIYGNLEAAEAALNK